MGLVLIWLFDWFLFVGLADWLFVVVELVGWWFYVVIVAVGVCGMVLVFGWLLCLVCDFCCAVDLYVLTCCFGIVLGRVVFVWLDVCGGSFVLGFVTCIDGWFYCVLDLWWICGLDLVLFACVNCC